MSDSSDFSPDDELVAQFELERERAGSRTFDVEEKWITMYPHLAERFHDTRNIQEALDGSCLADDFSPPNRLGEFEIVREIARGGMGIVYEAIQKSVTRRVAIKTIKHRARSPQLKARFLREQRVLASLHQTHIVSIFTAGREGPLDYFAMPYIRGTALSTVVDTLSRITNGKSSVRTPTLGQLARMTSAPDTHAGIAASTLVFKDSVDQTTTPRVPSTDNRHMLSVEYYRSVARIMADVADAVQHTHDVNILHRDIKPSNIMVDVDEESWIIDFGLAGWASSSIPEHSAVAAELSSDASLPKGGGWRIWTTTGSPPRRSSPPTSCSPAATSCANSSRG